MSTPPDLRGALVRSWGFGGETFSWSLLVPCAEHGYRPLTLTYLGAVLLRGATVLDEVPLVEGRSYVVRSEAHETFEALGAPTGTGHGARHGGAHRVSFWPTPRLRIEHRGLSWGDALASSA